MLALLVKSEEGRMGVIPATMISLSGQMVRIFSISAAYCAVYSSALSRLMSFMPMDK